MPSSEHDYSDLSAVSLSCALEPSPEQSHTKALMATSQAIMNAERVRTEVIRAVDHDIAPGVQPDMTAHGAARDDWPALAEKILAADILVLGTPIWLGEKSSVATPGPPPTACCSPRWGRARR